MSHWRLIYHPAQNGPTNMAIDQAVMEAVGRKLVPPTLRFYAWDPPCLSLGYAQSHSDVDAERLRINGWDIVRRPTGGKAILHVDELTYSVALLESNPIVRGGVVESYRRLSAALLGGLDILKVGADITSREKGGQATGPVCFEVPSNYEITALGKKLIGSAQVRRKQTVLQHGTLPLDGDITRIVDALYFETDIERETARQKVASRATTIKSILGFVPDWEVVADALHQSFASTFELSFIESHLTDDEMARAIELRETIYADIEWTQRH